MIRPADDLIEPKNDRSFLRHAISDRVLRYPAMLGEEERRLPSFLAALVAEQPGCIVELGCYLGGSTTSILEGLASRHALAGGSRPAIHSYDLFLANDFMVDHTLRSFGVTSGDSFRRVFDQLLADWLPYVQVHEGNILDEHWSGEPIKLLYVDILWSWEINQHVFDQFYRRLERGSWLLHQDYVYSCYPWLPISMEWLVENGYFAFRSYAQFSTVAFECLQSPAAVDEEFGFSEDLSLAEKTRLLTKAATRFTGYPRALLELTKCVMYSHAGNADDARACLDQLEKSSSHPIVEEHLKMVRQGLRLA